MKTIAFVSRKGGTGKTTLLVNIAWTAARRGYRCLVADVDPHHSASEALKNRADAPAVIETIGGKLHTLRLAAEREGVELLFIDTPGHLDANALQGIHVADFCVLVSRPNYLDLAGAVMTGRSLQQLGKRAIAVLNQTPPRRRGAEHGLTLKAREALKFVGYPIAHVAIGGRLAFEIAISAGQPVELHDRAGLAADEIARLWVELSEQIGIPAENCGPSIVSAG